MKTKTEVLAFDSNAIIYFLQGVAPYFQVLDPIVRSVVAGERTAIISVVSEAEVMVKPLRFHDAEALVIIDSLFSEKNVQVVPVDRVIAAEAAQLRANLGLSLADALIIATAMQMKCDAIIGNDQKCAKRVRGLPYVYLDDAVQAEPAT